MAANHSLQIATEPSGKWVQTEREAHEKWARLINRHPKAASLMHVLISRMGRNNAVVASHKTLASLTEVSARTIRRAIEVLELGNWIEVRQIGPTGTANAYIINDRVAWYGKRDGIRYSLFSATVVVSEEEQPDREELGSQEPLQRLPDLLPGERQLPSGEGLPPPSEPSLPSMEMDLPARQVVSGED